MVILVLPKEKYPTNRPMLVELWGRQISQRKIRLVWVMQSESVCIGLKKKIQGNNFCYILPRIQGNGTAARIVNHLINFSGKMVLGFFFSLKFKIRVVHVHCGPEEGVISLILSKIFRSFITYAYTSHFLLLEPSKPGKNNIIKKVVEDQIFVLRKIFYRMILKQAHLVFPISTLLKQQLIKEINIPACRMFTIPECAGTIFLDYPKPKRVSRKKKIQLVYVGSLGRTRNIPFIIDLFEIVHKKIKDCELVLIGWGHDKNDIPLLKQYAAARKDIASKIIFHPKIPYHKIPEVISRYDIGLSFIPPTDRYIFATPTKCIEYMSLQIPVAANQEIPDQCHVVSASNGGILTEYNINKAAQGVLRLAEDAYLRKKCGENGYHWIKKNRTFELLAPAVVKKLKDLHKCQ